MASTPPSTRETGTPTFADFMRDNRGKSYEQIVRENADAIMQHCGLSVDEALRFIGVQK